MAKKSFFEYAKFISKFEAVTDNLTKAKCYVLALGANANRTNFRKEVVDDAFETLGFIPVVGHLIKGEDGKHYLGGHDYLFDKETMEFESLCEPFGVVLPSESPTYELVTEDDGTENTYLTCDVVLWTGRYPALKEAVYNDKIMFGQSMEIYIEDSAPLEENKKITDVLKFRFDALCMLNKSDDAALNVEPCFPSASIVSEYSKDSEVFTAFVRDIKEQLKEYFNKGETVLDNENKTEVFSATYGQKRKAIATALGEMSTCQKNDDGECVARTKYYLMDFDDVHCFISKENWGDGKYSVENFRIGYSLDESNGAVTFSGEPEAIESIWVTAEEKAKLDEKVVTFENAANAAKEELETYQASHSHTNEEFDELAGFKASTLAEQKKAEIAALFAKYDERLGNVEEYINLKENYGEATIDEIEDKCLRMVGMQAMSAKAEKKVDFAKSSAGAVVEEQFYGGFIDHYAPNVK